MKKVQVSWSLFLLVTVLVAPCLSASVIPGRWEKVEQLPAQSELWLVLFSGERLHGSFSQSTPDGIILKELGGHERELPKSSIRKIVQIGERHTDSVWSGLAIGAAAGAGSYLIGHAVLCCAPNAAHDATGAAFFAAIGMGIGALIDATQDSDESVIYRARKQTRVPGSFSPPNNRTGSQPSPASKRPEPGA